MNREKLRRQAQVLRNKKYRRAHSAKVQLNPQPPSKPIVKEGVVKVSQPLPNPPKQMDMTPPNRQEIRRMRAEKILEQRKKLANRRKMRQQDKQLKPAPRGCSGCHRRRINK